MSQSDFSARAKPAVQRAKGAQTIYSLKNFNILLAEDYDFMQGLVSSMLRAFGVGGVMICGDAREAIELLTITQTHSRNSGIKGVDLILTDWMMPGGMGIELVDWVRNHKSDQIRFTPIMLLTAFTSETIIGTARDHGVNETLVKPVSGEKMASRILNMIDHPRSYVKMSSYFGPDRRRRDKERKGEERRVTPTEQIVQHTERL